MEILRIINVAMVGVSQEGLDLTEKLELIGLVVCRDCGHVASDMSRHVMHLQEARHINSLRSLAYRYLNIIMYDF